MAFICGIYNFDIPAFEFAPPAQTLYEEIFSNPLDKLALI